MAKYQPQEKTAASDLPKIYLAGPFFCECGMAFTAIASPDPKDLKMVHPNNGCKFEHKIFEIPSVSLLEIKSKNEQSKDPEPEIQQIPSE